MKVGRLVPTVLHSGQPFGSNPNKSMYSQTITLVGSILRKSLNQVKDGSLVPTVLHVGQPSVQTWRIHVQSDNNFSRINFEEIFELGEGWTSPSLLHVIYTGCFSHGQAYIPAINPFGG